MLFRSTGVFTRRLVSDTVTIKKAGAQTGSQVTNREPFHLRLVPSSRTHRSISIVQISIPGA